MKPECGEEDVGIPQGDVPDPERAVHASPTRRSPAGTRAPTPRLVTGLPVANAAALATFEEIRDCEYQTTRMGRTRVHDDHMCECTLAYGEAFACSDEGGCINRLTQVECQADMCRCGASCQNQRFQKHQYADVDIVQTPNKGFGLRAATALSTDALVYEYVGEVISHPAFMRRMEQYKEEHIEHFYFMMLQKDEYIDATKRGGRSRFINHSCNPNCYVSKWHVGRQVRMGIFAKRNVLAGEELTFNYNVDRYGNDPQECFCGEANCVGTLGGRTQTDVVTMDDLYIDALGIADEVARLRATLPRGKRSKILDEDFQPTLRAVEEPETPRVITAVRQATGNRNILHKLLTRIAMTEAVSVHKAFVKLHGFVVMGGVLDEWMQDAEMIGLALQCLSKWPLLARDKVVDSGVEDQVRMVAKRDVDDKNASALALAAPALAAHLLGAWAKLESTFRIARRACEGDRAAEPVDDPDTSVSWADRRRAEAELALRAAAPAATELTSDQLRLALLAYRNADERVPAEPRAVSVPQAPALVRAEPLAARESVLDIIRRVNEENEARRLREAAAAEAESAAAAATPLQGANGRARQEQRESDVRAHARKRRRQEGASRDATSNGREKRADAAASAGVPAAERRLSKLVGAIVVKQMSKVKERLDRDKFKRHAKELTRIISGKEMKNPKTWPPRATDGSIALDELSDEKRKKIKLFAHEYIKKLVHHGGGGAAGQADRRRCDSHGAAEERRTTGADADGTGFADAFDAAYAPSASPAASAASASDASASDAADASPL
ncbi:[histone H3]-lysine(4) N-trimethyltransferase [Malassezia sp. CBS 17886]|nr:[histone H3]-lysine(4) N-trimethyltransferase [Malassezia sp. CBS 17886]